MSVFLKDRCGSGQRLWPERDTGSQPPADLPATYRQPRLCDFLSRFHESQDPCTRTRTAES